MSRKSKETSQLNKIKCIRCEKEKAKSNYYINENPLFPTDKTIICKDCIYDYIGEKDSSGYLDRIIMILSILNRPFLYDLWERSDKDWNKYIPQLSSLNQNKDLTFKDSDFLNGNQIIKEKNNPDSIETEYSNNIDLVIKWGSGYSDVDLLQLEKFYDEMVTANEIQTPQHRAQLELLCKLHIAQNKALAEERYNDFKKINEQYNKTLENSGFRPIDKQSGGESSGIRTFSQIWEEIERDGFIKPAPIEENQDIVDKTIMYMSNYTRKLLNMQSLSDPQEDTPKVDENE